VTGKTDRTTLGRKADRGSHDREFVYEILDSSRVGHLGYVIDGQPYVIPIAHARMGDQLVFHGSTGARLFLNLGSGTPVCYTVTHFDGLVLSRSAFESSMNYRSAIVLGSCRLIEDEDEKWAALDVLTDHLFPGRRDSLRPMVKKEVAATAVLALPIEEFSAKSRCRSSSGCSATPSASMPRSSWCRCCSGQRSPLRSGVRCRIPPSRRNSRAR